MKYILVLAAFAVCGCTNLAQNAEKTFRTVRAAAAAVPDVVEPFCGKGNVIPAAKIRAGDETAVKDLVACERAKVIAHSAAVGVLGGQLAVEAAAGDTKDEIIQAAINAVLKWAAELQTALAYWGVKL